MKKKAAAAVLSAVMALSIPAVSNAALDTREISIVPIAAYTAQGNEQALKKALVEGLNNGMTVNEIKEVLVQMYAYTGFPRSLTGLGVFVNLLKKEKPPELTIRSVVVLPLCPKESIFVNWEQKFRLS